MAHKRIFGDMELRRLLDALRQCRSTCTDLARHMPIGEGDKGAIYRANGEFLHRIDDFVGVLTGDRDALLTKLKQSDGVLRAGEQRKAIEKGGA